MKLRLLSFYDSPIIRAKLEFKWSWYGEVMSLHFAGPDATGTISVIIRSDLTFELSRDSLASGAKDFTLGLAKCWGKKVAA